MGEYYALCILQAMKMCIFEVVSHSIDIVNYLVPMWHVLLKQVQICLNGLFDNIFVDLVRESFSWNGFPQCVSHILFGKSCASSYAIHCFA